MNADRSLHSVIFIVKSCVEATEEGVAENKRIIIVVAVADSKRAGISKNIFYCIRCRRNGEGNVGQSDNKRLQHGSNC